MGGKRLTKDGFIDKAKSIHGDRYDYSLVNYVNSTIKVKIICKIHGEFEQAPYKHYIRKGCSKCSNNITSNENFINKAKIIPYSQKEIEKYLICELNKLK